VVVGLLMQPQRELPTDVWLPVHWPFADLAGGDMERATNASGEARAVEKDAGIVGQRRGRRALFVSLQEAVSSADVEELPVHLCQPLL
jgi:hypothetical protein